jgi:hypothetical protein
MQDIQRRCIGQGGIGCQPQSFQIANRRCGLAVDVISRIWDARQHLERPCQVDLIDTLEHKGTDTQDGVMRDHGALLRVGMDKASLNG